jgi:hypothetical protein
MATLRYRTSANWESLRTRELPTKKEALAEAINTIDLGISIGDLTIDGIRMTLPELIKALKEEEN